MTQSEVNGLKGIVSILKSRLEDAEDKREEISDRLTDLEDVPLSDAIRSIDKMMTLDNELDEYLTDLSDAIDDLEDALATAEITEE